MRKSFYRCWLFQCELSFFINCIFSSATVAVRQLISRVSHWLNRYVYREKRREWVAPGFSFLKDRFLSRCFTVEAGHDGARQKLHFRSRIPTEVGTIATATKDIAARRLPHAYCSDWALRILPIKNLLRMRTNRNVSCSKKLRSSCINIY